MLLTIYKSWDDPPSTLGILPTPRSDRNILGPLVGDRKTSYSPNGTANNFRTNTKTRRREKKLGRDKKTTRESLHFEQPFKMDVVLFVDGSFLWHKEGAFVWRFHLSVFGGVDWSRFLDQEKRAVIVGIITGF